MDLLTVLLAEDWATRLVDAAAQNYIFSVIGVVAIVCIVFGTIKGMVTGTAREKTRREIAAYIAEGSMTSDQGERLMKAREPSDE